MSIRRMASDVSARQPSGKTDSVMNKVRLRSDRYRSNAHSAPARPPLSLRPLPFQRADLFPPHSPLYTVPLKTRARALGVRPCLTVFGSIGQAVSDYKWHLLVAGAIAGTALYFTAADTPPESISLEPGATMVNAAALSGGNAKKQQRIANLIRVSRPHGRGPFGRG